MTISKPDSSARSFSAIPSAPMPPRHPRLRRLSRVFRWAAIALLVVTGVFTGATVFAPEATANPIQEVAAACGPLDPPYPEMRGSGTEAFLPAGQPVKTESKTVILGGDHGQRIKDQGADAVEGYDQVKNPTYERYGMTGLYWSAFGDKPGCYSVGRNGLIVPNFIFTVSKIFASITMLFVSFAFSSDPFAFLNPVINALASGTSTVMLSFLGVVGVAGMLYLFVASRGRYVFVMLKGLMWMGLVLGAFFWFRENPTLMSTKINSIVGKVTSQAFTSIQDVSQEAGAVASNCGQDTLGSPDTTGGDVPDGVSDGRSEAAKCIQGALWIPLVYEPWQYGAVGNTGISGDFYAPLLLNAQYIGTTADGAPDADGVKVLEYAAGWRGEPEYELGVNDKHEKVVYEGEYAKYVPYLRLWATDVCNIPGHDFAACWAPRPPGEVGFPDDDRAALEVMGGGLLETRFQGAMMSVITGTVINLSVGYISVMLLAAKLGVYVLMVFAPIYLMMGTFPGRQRVAAIALGEMILTNLFRQAGWAIALVLLTYMYIVVFQADVVYFIKIFTCAALTILAAIYAKPAKRALSGMAAGNKDAGREVEGVMAETAANAAKATAKVGATVGLAAVSGGASLAAAGTAAANAGTTLSAAGRLKALGTGIAKSLPPMSRVGAAVRGITGAKATGASVAAGDIAKQDQKELERQRTEAGEDVTDVKEARTNASRQQAARQVLNDSLNKAAALEGSGQQDAADDLRGRAHSRYSAITGEIDQRDPRLHAHRNINGDEEGVRYDHTGREMLANMRMTRGQAADNLDVVANAYGNNAANLDPMHEATPALREYMARQAQGGEAAEAALAKASEAVATNGIPNRVDVLGLESSSAPVVAAEASATALEEFTLAPRMETAVRISAMREAQVQAAAHPVGSAMNHALNNYASVAGNISASEQEMKRVVEQVRKVGGIQVDGGGDDLPPPGGGGGVPDFNPPGPPPEPEPTFEDNGVDVDRGFMPPNDLIDPDDLNPGGRNG